MPIKIFAAIVTFLLLLGFLSPVVLKLKDIELGAIILIGLVMALVDLWQSLQKEDE